MKAIITQNLIKDNPVTIQNVNLATQIFWKGIGVIKGKLIQQKLMQAMINMIKLPNELKDRTFNLILYVNIITINTCKFKTIITSELCYSTIHFVKSTKSSNIIRGLQEVIELYKDTLLISTEIHCDNEFKNAVTHIKNFLNQSIVPDFCNPQEHVPSTERNKCIIKDRCRSIYHNLPYN